MYPSQSPPRIRSFASRQGRATSAQQRALTDLWDTYCLDPLQAFDSTRAFGRTAPLIVEIGFGNGNALAATAEANPDINYLGIEVYKPGIAHLMLLLEQKDLHNVKIYQRDAIEIMQRKIADNSLAGVRLFFPDPWPKRRHHKRRIVQPSFVALLEQKLFVGAYFQLATDWDNYAEDMLKTLSAATQLINADANNRFCPRPSDRLLTKFERRGIRLGHQIRDLVFIKKMKSHE